MSHVLEMSSSQVVSDGEGKERDVGDFVVNGRAMQLHTSDHTHSS